MKASCDRAAPRIRQDAFDPSARVGKQLERREGAGIRHREWFSSFDRASSVTSALTVTPRASCGPVHLGNTKRHMTYALP